MIAVDFFFFLLSRIFYSSIFFFLFPDLACLLLLFTNAMFSGIFSSGHTGSMPRRTFNAVRKRKKIARKQISCTFTHVYVYVRQFYRDDTVLSFRSRLSSNIYIYTYMYICTYISHRDFLFTRFYLFCHYLLLPFIFFSFFTAS